VSVDRLAALACDAVRRDGHLGRESIDLIEAIMREETRRFPVLRPPAGWTPEEIEERVHAFLLEKLVKLTAALTASGLTAESTGKLVRVFVRNWLISQARKTPLGAIRRKLEEDVLAVFSEFRQVEAGAPGAGRWYLDGQSSYPFGGDERLLVAAAYAVPDVKPVRWSGPRRPPVASSADLRRIVQAILQEADGSLEVAQLVHVVALRFPMAAEAEDTTVDDEAFASVVSADDPAAEVGTSVTARAVFDQLSPAQRVILPLLVESDVDLVQERLKVGRSQAYAAAKRLRELLDKILPTDDTRGSVLAAVIDLCGLS
jgi:hypothetical protein